MFLVMSRQFSSPLTKSLHIKTSMSLVCHMQLITIPQTLSICRQRQSWRNSSWNSSKLIEIISTSPIIVCSEKLSPSKFERLPSIFPSISNNLIFWFSNVWFSISSISFLTISIPLFSKNILIVSNVLTLHEPVSAVEHVFCKKRVSAILKIKY